MKNGQIRDIMPTLTKIAGGTLYDPLNGIDGKIQDIWIAGSKICRPPDDPEVKPDRIFDATGLVVMPGGIDMHCHIAGPKVNVARKMRPEDKRRSPPVRRTAMMHSGTLGAVPSTFATGYKYAGLGYTTAFDAAVPPLAARHAHEEFDDMPCIDKGFYVLVGNNHYVMQAIADREPKRLKAFLAWILGSARSMAPKLVNPGGVEVWKHHAAGNVHSLDEPVDFFQVTPRSIIHELAVAADALRLPHPIHIHCNNLGLPGNWTTTLETMKALDGHRGHITHIQFHSYGGGEGDEDTFNSKVLPLVEYVNAHPEITIDVGQVLFGETTSMTGDGPLGYYLHRIYGGKWFSGDVEMEAGCGIAPVKYRNQSLVHSLQWAIGLEWFLLVDDPWRVVLSTDHPNGASFLTYPQVVRLLMDRTYRQDILATCPAKVRQRCTLADLDREYSMYEIAIITRAGPARILGLAHKGHLGPGADADITIYTPNENVATMFELPRLVMKAGEVIVENGELRAAPTGRTIHVAPAYDPMDEEHIRTWFEKHYSIQFRNYPVGDEYVHEPVVIGCK
ncbi:MAG: formylmethanofuran dehydrogenase subunit A [Pirellulales bacterium]|nr:formylmethanofuran dehydrogenase subunit A [Pirellulales bacterium]